jgi:hypothetical protein
LWKSSLLLYFALCSVRSFVPRSKREISAFLEKEESVATFGFEGSRESGLVQQYGTYLANADVNQKNSAIAFSKLPKNLAGRSRRQRRPQR